MCTCDVSTERTEDIGSVVDALCGNSCCSKCSAEVGDEGGADFSSNITVLASSASKDEL
jgi:hypothetical protein